MTSARNISTSAPRAAPRWLTCPAFAPTIVAESLERVADPLLTALRPGPLASGQAVARALVRSLASQEDDCTPPEWLRPSQAVALRRVLGSLRRYRGALLADPVGSGKTYVALAAARVCNGAAPTLCLVPASLAAQWRRVANRLGIELTLHSHERLSRGVPPPSCRGLVVIDESHHFRNSETRRYAALAPWLAGRPTLLVSGTPIVNRLRDLANQLLLAVRDDALAPRGLPSISRALDLEEAHPAIGDLVVSRPIPVDRGPSRTDCRIQSPLGVGLEESSYLLAIDRLTLSQERPTAVLVRGVLWRAAASSPAALLGVLRRYRRLLRHAEDARAGGRELDRAELRRFTAGMEEQLVMWPLLPGTGLAPDLVLEDLPAVGQLMAEVERRASTEDPKCRRLRRLLRDGRRTLVFATPRETVHYLRRLLDDLGVAWCSGDRAGVGPALLPRGLVLDAFRPGSASRGLRHLITTDVVAEGLDLHAAERIVHYDLPWTQVRMDQRDGRALRLGSPHRRVEVVRFEPSPLIEERLAQVARLTSKARLPRRAGMGVEGRAIWGWADDLTGVMGNEPGIAGVARVRAGDSGVLVGFTLVSRTAAGRSIQARGSVGWLTENGGWTESSAVVEPKLGLAAASGDVLPLAEAELAAVLQQLCSLLKDRLRSARGSLWSAAHSPETRRLIRRLRRMAAEAARARKADRLRSLDRAIRFVAGGHTAGEARLVRHLAGASESELRSRLRSLPAPDPPWEEIEPKLVGVIVFGPDEG